MSALANSFPFNKHPDMQLNSKFRHGKDTLYYTHYDKALTCKFISLQSPHKTLRGYKVKCKYCLLLLNGLSTFSVLVYITDRQFFTWLSKSQVFLWKACLQMRQLLKVVHLGQPYSYDFFKGEYGYFLECGGGEKN